IEVNNFHMNYLTYMGIGLRADVPSINYPYLYTKYKADPYEFNVFIQDKLEWEGLIMNAGLRATMWAPGMDGFDLNPSNYYNSDAWGGYATWKSEGGYVPGEANYEFRNQHTRKIKHKILLQPRLGISHPITTSSKIFFNYGHFYQRPSYHDMYWICANKGGYGTYGQGMIPSPDMAWPKTVSYEIGYSQSIYDQILLQVSGYYKDYTNSNTSLNIVSYYGDLDYLALTTNGYRDVRGIELRLERSFGRFINGWVNYNYMIQSRGTTSFDTIYENPVLADDQWSSISQPRVDARPSIRTSLTLRTPVGFGPGPAILGIKPLAEWRVNTIVTWRDGGERVYDSSLPYKSWNYVQNIDRTTADMYIRKTIARGASLYINVRNLFNIKYYRTTSQYSQSLRYPWTSPSGNDEYGVHDRYYVQKSARDGYDMWNTLRRDVYFGIRYQF
ncbi:TonB-dependent receptor, partial [bacterium]|nr:TonB-dependent receptor [bacterium]